MPRSPLNRRTFLRSAGVGIDRPLLDAMLPIGHVAFDRKNNQPLSNLFVRMLHQVGIEADRFGSSTGTLGPV